MRAREIPAYAQPRRLPARASTSRCPPAVEHDSERPVLGALDDRVNGDASSACLPRVSAAMTAESDTGGLCSLRPLLAEKLWARLDWNRRCVSSVRVHDLGRNRVLTSGAVPDGEARPSGDSAAVNAEQPGLAGLPWEEQPAPLRSLRSPGRGRPRGCARRPRVWPVTSSVGPLLARGVRRVHLGPEHDDARDAVREVELGAVLPERLGAAPTRPLPPGSRSRRRPRPSCRRSRRFRRRSRMKKRSGRRAGSPSISAILPLLTTITLYIGQDCIGLSG